MTHFVIVEYRAVPGQEDRLRTALEALIEPALDDPRCLAFGVYVDPNDLSRMMTFQRWDSRQAYDAHATTAPMRHAQTVLDRILIRPPTIRPLIDAPPA
ncbi:putative quinol monooxygenase [Nocardia heshunensis]